MINVNHNLIGIIYLANWHTPFDDKKGDPGEYRVPFDKE